MTVQDYIKQLTDKAEHPVRTILEAKDCHGKKLVGWVAPYAPEEIIYAAGAIPVGLWGGKVELKKARTYLPTFACSIMQSIMEYEATGGYDMLDAVLIPAHCDTLKCFGQKWKGKCPAIPFVYPQNRRVDCANDFLVSEYNLIREKLEKILECTITEQALSDAIILYNEYRSTARTFERVAAEYPQTITPIVRHQIIKAAQYMDKKEYTEILKHVIYELRRSKPETWGGKRFIITGIEMADKELLKIFEEFNVNIAGDDLAEESRQYRTDVPFYGSAMGSLAKQWQVHDACSLAYDPFKRRVRYLSELAKARNADGVVIALMKFCDPEEYDVPIIMSEMEKQGIPLLVLEIDQQSNSYEQIRTRLQSFIECME